MKFVSSFVAILGTLCATEVVLGQDPGNAAKLAARMMTRPTEPLLAADATCPEMADSSTPHDTESPMFVPDAVWHADGCLHSVHEQGRIPLFPYWDHGLRIISEDERFNIHVGGNAQWDSVWLIGPQGVLGVPKQLDEHEEHSGIPAASSADQNGRKHLRHVRLFSGIRLCERRQ